MTVTKNPIKVISDSFLVEFFPAYALPLMDLQQQMEIKDSLVERIKVGMPYSQFRDFWPGQPAFSPKDFPKVECGETKSHSYEIHFDHQGKIGQMLIQPRAEVPHICHGPS